MTLLEEYNSLKQRLEYLEKQIKKDKKNKINEFCDNAIGQHIKFDYEDDTYYMYVDKLEGVYLIGNTIRIYEGGINKFENQKIRFDEEITNYKIMNKEEFYKEVIDVFNKLVLSVLF